MNQYFYILTLILMRIYHKIKGNWSNHSSIEKDKNDNISAGHVELINMDT